MKSLVEKTISYNNGSIKFSAQFNKRLSNCFTYIKFNTSEKRLLYVILQKYIHEKVLFYGCNLINDIYNAIATTNGILFVSSEKKILTNIANILAYICKTKLSRTELKQVMAKTANYNKLHNDVLSFSVYTTGKVIHIIRSITNSDDKKLDKFGEMLGKIQRKDIETADINNEEVETFKFNGNDRNKLDLSIVLENVPFVFNKDEIILLSHSCHCVCNTGYDYMQSKLKVFLNSCGSPGSPAANDEGGVKHKEKCRYILECLNYMTFIISDLHGFSYKFNNIKEITDGVSADSKTKIKECLKAFGN